MQKKFYRNVILPRLYFPIYYLHKVIIHIYSFLIISKKQRDKTLLVLSAGIKGWDSIEFKELYDSALEYLGSDKVFQHRVVDTAKYYADLSKTLNGLDCTHFFYDPRTGNQRIIGGTWEAIRIAFLLTGKGITPIVLSTDLSIRSWRIKSALVSAISGIVICFVSPRRIFPIFPHRRLFGPCLMPLSLKTFNQLATLKKEKCKENNHVVFIGSLYEPRTTILNNIRDGLQLNGYDLDIRGRVLGGPRKPDSEYWSTMVNADIILTTADQIYLPQTDWYWVQNLVYRYVEAMAAGSLLIAPAVTGVDRYFEPNIHFVAFTTPAEAIEKIVYYLENKLERDMISAEGNKMARSLVESKIFWTLVDGNLSHKSLK